MTDHFALFNEARRPWIEAEDVKAKFLALSAEAHPDRVHDASAPEKLAVNERFFALNAAHNCLREPKDRLRHLLELELGALPADSQRNPAELMNLFMEVSQLCRDVDIFLAERAKVTSPLIKVRRFEHGLELTGKLLALQDQIAVQRGGLHRELRSMNAAWESAPAVGSVGRRAALPLERLENIYRTLSYFTRWSAQLQERVVQISF